MLYDEMLSKCWTTIYMPEWRGAFGTNVTLHSGLLRLPFPVVRFVEPFFYSVASINEATDEFFANGPAAYSRENVLDCFPNGIRGCDELIMFNVDGDPDRICCRSRTTWSNGVEPLPPQYGPEHPRQRTTEWGITLQRFNSWIADRSARFKPSPITRQVRRYHGFSPEYSEYIIMRKESTPREDFTGGLSMRKLVPMVMKAHPVRAHRRQEHLRTLRNGEIMVVPETWVSAHVRGKGDAIQVKDYQLK